MVTLVYNEASLYPKRRNTRQSSARVKLRSYTAAKWQETNFRLSENELAFDKTNRRLKIGDGVNHWNDLPYLNINISGNFEGMASIEELNALAAFLNQSNALNDGRLDSLEGRDLALTALLNAQAERLDALEAGTTGGGGAVDLSNYATLDDLVLLQGSISGLASGHNSQVSQINDLINRTTALENAPAPTVDLSGYVTTVTYNALLDAVNALSGRVTYLEQNGGGGTGGGGVVVYPVVPFNQNYDVTLPQLGTKTLEFTIAAGDATVKSVYLLQASANYTDFYGPTMRGVEFTLEDEFGGVYLTKSAPASGDNLSFKWTGLNISQGRYIIKIKHLSNSEPQNRRVYLGT